MSKIVVPLQRPVPTRTVLDASERLQSIWSVVEAFASQLQREELLTPNEMARILRIFDTANQCIRIVLSDFGKDPAIDQLIDHSRKIKALIEIARDRIVNLPATTSAA